MAFSETISAVGQKAVDGLEGTVDAMGANGSAVVGFAYVCFVEIGRAHV